MNARASAAVPDQQTLRDAFDYCPTTGRLLWRISTARRVRIGSPAGHIRASDGRRSIRLNNIYFRADYAVWVWHHGTLPQHGIAHRNGVMTDDRIGNLVDANTYGHLPPSTLPEVKRTRDGKYRVTLSLGSFDDPLVAALVLARAKATLNEHNNGGGGNV